MWYSDPINRIMVDNAITKKETTKHTIVHRKLKIEQHEPHYKSGVYTGPRKCEKFLLPQ